MNGIRDLKYQYIDDSVDPGAKYASAEKLGEGSVVDAVYSHAPLASDAGNPFIEALPVPRRGTAFSLAYNTGIPGFSHSETVSLPAEAQADLIDNLDMVRVPLPVSKDIEESFHSSIREGYRLRMVSVAENPGQYCPVVEAGETRESAVVMNGRQASGEFRSLALIGFSGTGKTSTIEDLIKDCPQVIHHSFPDTPTVTQIAFVLAQAETNDNLRGLLLNIAKGIDRALHNHRPFYYAFAEKQKSIPSLSHYIISLIETFSVGVIILDEVQNCNFRKNRQSSFEALLNITNQTKCRLILVGTEKAVSHITDSPQMTRRYRPVDFSLCCRDRQFFAWMVRRFFNYQWFEPEVILSDDARTEELIDALYKCSFGVVGVFKELYKKMTRDYVFSAQKPEIDALYVRRTAERYSSELLDKYPHLRDPLLFSGKLLTDDPGLAADVGDAALSAMKASKEIVEGNVTDDVDRIEALKNKVIRNIRIFTKDYNAVVITRAFNRITKGKGPDDLGDEMDVTREVFEALKEKSAQKKQRKASTSKAEKMPDSDIDAALGLDQVG